MNEETEFNFNSCELNYFKITPSAAAVVLDFSKFISEQGPTVFKKINQKASEYCLKKLIPEILSPKIGYETSGKPYLLNSSFCISKSHSHSKLAICIDKKKRTGCDIELIRPKVINVRAKFLNENELPIISSESIEKNIIAWSVKESLLKVNSTKTFNFRDKITILELNSDNERETICKAILEEEKIQECSLRSWKIENYIFTCVESITEKDEKIF